MIPLLGYKFQDADLLEEALRGIGSSVLVVGKSKRMCETGESGVWYCGRGGYEVGAAGSVLYV
jgi:hypothetical protein